MASLSSAVTARQRPTAARAAAEEAAVLERLYDTVVGRWKEKNETGDPLGPSQLFEIAPDLEQPLTDTQLSKLEQLRKRSQVLLRQHYVGKADTALRRATLQYPGSGEISREQLLEDTERLCQQLANPLPLSELGLDSAASSSPDGGAAGGSLSAGIASDAAVSGSAPRPGGSSFVQDAEARAARQIGRAHV